ncbi:hypothetical protein T4D_646 [Trichinella pseudospiralis]|uniref:Uncharacterized protein n=1 Tax=Trichinella pseudospiralis TaxID=6337 RepID=A0A0V1FEZ3_TRIPS|nr:hypothetical protein T4D_646 [Trichinella pseudospiralis]
MKAKLICINFLTSLLLGSFVVVGGVLDWGSEEKEFFCDAFIDAKSSAINTAGSLQQAINNRQLIYLHKYIIGSLRDWCAIVREAIIFPMSHFQSM